MTSAVDIVYRPPYCTIYITDIAEHKNVCASRRGASSWVNVSEEKMKAFFSIHVSMVLVHLLSLYDYWSTKPLIAVYQPQPANCCGLSHCLFKDRSAMLDYRCWCAWDTANCCMALTFTRVLAVHWMRLPRCYSVSTYDGATVWPQSSRLQRHIPGKQAIKEWNVI